MPGSMDTQPEARQPDDDMTQTADQLTASLARVRRARQVLHDASDRLTQTRQELEKEPRLERVRQARELLHATNQQLAQTHPQVEDDEHRNAAGPATDD